MRVYKFGGASVKDANAVRNVGEVLKKMASEPVLVVISAMGKTTNKLEELVKACLENNGSKKEIFEEIKSFHFAIVSDLITDEYEFYEVDNLFIELECFMDKVQDGGANFDYTYDQIISFGELISTKIVSIYLNKSGYKNRWIDARNFVATDSNYRNANVQWHTTNTLIANSLKPLLTKQTIITQGFIGRSDNLSTTTLGREGSDYSAAIFAHALDAESVTIWKDVKGVMNGDPKLFEDAILIPELTYNEAIELAYYGASVIHPKTIQPLKSKKIPLYVKSFVNTDLSGTVVFESDNAKLNNTPCFIVKENQTLIEIASKDFSFIVEDNLHFLFKHFSQNGIQINVMQNTAISFTACYNTDEKKTARLMESLVHRFNVKFEDNKTLFTVFNYDQKTEEILKFVNNRKIILEQQTHKTLQVLIEN